MGDRFEPKSLTFKASKRPYRKISNGRYFAFNPIPHYGYYKIRSFFGILFFSPLEDNSAVSALTPRASMGLSGCSFKWEGAQLLHSKCANEFLSFSANKFGLLIKKVILQYNVYVILCFLHSLLKCCCVGVYRGFENLFKKLF